MNVNLDDDLTSLAALACDAAVATRDILGKGQRDRAGSVASQLGRDIKLREDAESEIRIRSVLAAATPYPIFGEEQGWGGAEPADGLHWVVDPLDGSFNYYRGIPLYAVAIALCRGRGEMREALLGAIYDPERDELVSGGPATGLFVNKVRISAPSTGAKQILATGYPTKADPDAVNAALKTAAAEWTKIRMLGSAALSLAWVATGRMDGYEEQDIMWWDVAAGLALARAAGVRQVEWRFTGEDRVHVRVSN